MSEANGCLLSLNCLEWLFISGAMVNIRCVISNFYYPYYTTLILILGVCAADTVTSYRCFLHSSLFIRLLFVVNREMARCFRLNLVFLAQTRTFARSQALILLAQLAWLELGQYYKIHNTTASAAAAAGSKQQNINDPKRKHPLKIELLRASISTQSIFAH